MADTFDRTKYDTKESIEELVTTYAGLYELIAARDAFRMARYEREDAARAARNENFEREPNLHSFIVLGRFGLFPQGEVAHVRRTVMTDDDRARSPDVLTLEEWKTFADPIAKRASLHDAMQLFEGVAGNPPELPIPPPHMRCPRCRQGFETLSETHEIVGEREFFDVKIPLDEFCGKMLRKAQEALLARTDGVYHIRTNIRNDRRKLSEEEHHERRRSRKHSADMMEGWRTDDEHSDPRISWEYVIQPGDEAGGSIDRYFHATCGEQRGRELERAQHEDEDAEWTHMFTAVGFDNVRITRAPAPDYLIAWLKTMAQQDDDVPDAAQLREVQYQRVETAQGTFGIWTVAYPMIDLHGTGVTCEKLTPDWLHQLPGEQRDAWRDIAPFDVDGAVFHRLFTLLVKRQLAAAPPSTP